MDKVTAEPQQYGRVVAHILGKLRSAPIECERVHIYRLITVHWSDILPGDFVAALDGSLHEVVEVRPVRPDTSP